MDITIEPLSQQNARAVFDFEVENRAFFEIDLPSRGDGYYDYDSYCDIIKEILVEQGRGECFMYVIRGEAGLVLGRVNVTAVQDNAAELGYRIGQAAAGKGVATRAVALALQLAASKHGLNKITAGTSPQNIASQKVLEKNGFSPAGKTKVNMGGEPVDSLQYVKLLANYGKINEKRSRLATP